MINMAFMPLYMWEMWDVTPVTNARTDTRTVESSAVFSLSWIRNNWLWLIMTFFLEGPSYQFHIIIQPKILQHSNWCAAIWDIVLSWCSVCFEAPPKYYENVPICCIDSNLRPPIAIIPSEQHQHFCWLTSAIPKPSSTDFDKELYCQTLQLSICQTFKHANFSSFSHPSSSDINYEQINQLSPVRLVKSIKIVNESSPFMKMVISCPQSRGTLRRFSDLEMIC